MFALPCSPCTMYRSQICEPREIVAARKPSGKEKDEGRILIPNSEGDDLSVVICHPPLPPPPPNVFFPLSRFAEHPVLHMHLFRLLILLSFFSVSLVVSVMNIFFPMFSFGGSWRVSLSFIFRNGWRRSKNAPTLAPSFYLLFKCL